MGRYTGKTCRLLCMLVLTASFFLVEIVVGYVTNSLALVGDSYHMLSDVIALVIGFASVRISKWRSNKNTYGWARAEVLGALINAVFLIALCFTIFVEALQRLSSDDHINNPDLMLIVGGVGLGVNIIGLALFGSHSHGGHGHSHGGGGSHGHSHGGGGKKKKSHGHSHDDDNDQLHHAIDGHSLSRADNHSHDHSENNVKNRGTGSNNDLHSSSDQEEHFPIVDVEEVNTMKLKSSSQLNMKAVFLHVMGDALGSVIVIISALVIKYVEADWKYKLDPAMSLVLVIIILSTSIPLMRESALILLQTVPTHIQVHEIQKKLISKVEGVLAVHEFHVWQLAGNRIIASAHIRCQNLRDYMRIAEQVKLFFHNEGIHSTTIQPEFSEEVDMEPVGCLQDGPCRGEPCQTMTCCPDDDKKNKKPSWLRGVRKRTRKRPVLGETQINGNEDGVAFCQPLCEGEEEEDEDKENQPDTYSQGCQCSPVDHIFHPDGLVIEPNQPHEKPGREEARSHSEPRPEIVSNGGNSDGNSIYRPTFQPPVKASRPHSMYAILPENPPVSPRRTMSTDAMDGKKSNPCTVGELQSKIDVENQLDAIVTSNPSNDCSIPSINGIANSQDALQEAIKNIKRDLKGIRGDTTSRESFLE